MKQYKDHAVSPVVGVMLMLVVTIIIAAIVSGFAGGLVKAQTKVPQATITGTFSVTSGMTIIHSGGDPVPTAGIVITTKAGPNFGPNLESYSLNPVNLSTVTNSAGTPIAYFNPLTKSIDGYNVTSFNPGDTWYINISNCNPALLQPTLAGHVGRGHPTFLGYTWNGNTWGSNPSNAGFWYLNFVNPSNIGKSFYLDVNAKDSGALISESLVTITG
jgi:FlaG/FlaF family flagellin (archaellin)